MLKLETIQEDIASLPPDAQEIIFDLIEVLKKRYSVNRQIEPNSNTKTDNQVSTLDILKQAGLIGCISAESDLSTNYKSIIKEGLESKYDHR